MARLHRSHSGTRTVQRLACEQIAAASELLSGRSVTDRRIHDARKKIRRARGSLRLIRDALGDAVFVRENAALRDAARALSQARDAKVLAEALDTLTVRHGERMAALPLGELRELLQREQRAARQRILHGADTTEASRAILGRVSLRAQRWHAGAKGWRTIEAGLQRVYRHGYRVCKQIRRRSTPESLHEWRKQTRYLWYLLEILEPLWPAAVAMLAGQARRLADCLGSDHDLAMLRAKVVANGQVLSGRALREFLALIDLQRSEFEAQAMLLGRSLYMESPQLFVARFAVLWRQWRRPAR